MGLESIPRVLEVHPYICVLHNPVLKTQFNEMTADIAC